jgi:hypothetical protein
MIQNDRILYNLTSISPIAAPNIMALPAKKQNQYPTHPQVRDGMDKVLTETLKDVRASVIDEMDRGEAGAGQPHRGRVVEGLAAGGFQADAKKDGGEWWEGGTG